MDNEYLMESNLVEVIDKDWAKDSLPADDIAVSHFFCTCAAVLLPVFHCYFDKRLMLLVFIT